MKRNYFLQFLTVSIALFFFVTCTSPTKSNKSSKTIVQIANVWISDALDNDGDGYNSYVRLNFDLDVNKPDSIDVFVILGVRITDPMDTASYYVYFESIDFKIAGQSTSDGKYISIGSPNLEMPFGTYDFLLEVYFSADPNTRVAYATKTEDPDMGDIMLEESSTDIIQQLDIYDAFWSTGIDRDNDGYYSQRDLVVDVDVNSGTANIYLEIYVKEFNSSTYNLAATTNSFFISGGSSGDAVATTISNGSHGLYDFKVVAYFNGSNVIEDEYDSSDDADLDDVPFETSAEDPLLSYTIISYNDGSFENGYYWASNTGYFAVRFDQPVGATSCFVKQIRFYIYENSADVRVRVWDNSGNLPNNYLYFTGAGEESFLTRYVWNTVLVDVDVSASDPFFAGYYQHQTGMPLIGADETTPLYGRSYYKALSASNWTNDTGADYGIEVYVEYTTTSITGEPIVNHKWLSAETY